MAAESRPPHLALLVALAWLVIVAQLLATSGSEVAHSLGDTDDALRLAQVHAFLSGQGWFDLHEARLGPPPGYDSHWSRLIDAGLAGLFMFFRLFADAHLAERLMRVVWPMLWLLPAIAAGIALAWRMGGRAAALALLLMLVVALPAFSQFRPGRIDHHNVQITLALAAVALAAWCDVKRWAGAALGAVAGAALAIGLESLPFLVIAGGVPAVHFILDRRFGPMLRDFGLALAAATLAAFLVSVGPDHWSRTVCDTMAINWMLPVAMAGVMVAGIGQFYTDERVIRRAGAIATVALIAAGSWFFLDPRCIGGPFALMDPAVRPVWLAHVAEIQPLPAVMRGAPAMAAKIIAFPAMVLAALIAMSADRDMRRNPAFLVTGVAFLVAIAITMDAARMHVYAIWIGMPLVAAWSLALFTRFRMTTLAARAFTVLLLAPTTLSVGAIAAVKAATHGETGLEADARTRRGCFASASYEQLANLPAGMIATDIDYGPFILALTHHSALAGPYHRLSAGILAAHRVFALPPQGARDVVLRNHVVYVATCGVDPLADLTADERTASLSHHLAAGDLPDWLEKLPVKDGDVFTVYRVRPHIDAP
jgi:hypothetical protein